MWFSQSCTAAEGEESKRTKTHGWITLIMQEKIAANQITAQQQITANQITVYLTTSLIVKLRRRRQPTVHCRHALVLAGAVKVRRAIIRLHRCIQYIRVVIHNCRSFHVASSPDLQFQHRHLWPNAGHLCASVVARRCVVSNWRHATVFLVIFVVARCRTHILTHRCLQLQKQFPQCIGLLVLRRVTLSQTKVSLRNSQFCLTGLFLMSATYYNSWGGEVRGNVVLFVCLCIDISKVIHRLEKS